MPIKRFFFCQFSLAMKRACGPKTPPLSCLRIVYVGFFWLPAAHPCFFFISLLPRRRSRVSAFLGVYLTGLCRKGTGCACGPKECACGAKRCACGAKNAPAAQRDAPAARRNAPAARRRACGAFNCAPVRTALPQQHGMLRRIQLRMQVPFRVVMELPPGYFRNVNRIRYKNVVAANIINDTDRYQNCCSSPSVARPVSEACVSPVSQPFSVDS